MADYRAEKHGIAAEAQAKVCYIYNSILLIYMLWIKYDYPLQTLQVLIC